MGWRQSSGVLRPLTSSQELLVLFLPNLVCNICRVRSQEIINSMTPTKKDLNLIILFKICSTPGHGLCKLSR